MVNMGNNGEVTNIFHVVVFEPTANSIKKGAVAPFFQIKLHLDVAAILQQTHRNGIQLYALLAVHLDRQVERIFTALHQQCHRLATSNRSELFVKLLN